MCSSSQNSSMKKLISIVAVSLASLVTVVPASAQEQVAIAVIDSGFDSFRLSGNVAEEVCIVVSNRCNNAKGFDIGPGAAGSKFPISERHLQDWNHGTEMAKVIVGENPNVKLVLIRNSKIYGGAVLPGSEEDLLLALDWVSKNADKYNIAAVSFSRGSHSYVTTNREVSLLTGQIKVYANQVNLIKSKPVVNQKTLAVFETKLKELQDKLASLGTIACPVTDKLRSSITGLQSKQIATIVATGNDADRKYVDYPACIDDAVAVAAYDSNKQLAYVSNISSNTDFVARGNTTSEATARLAGKWSLMYNGNYTTTYNSIKNSGFTLDNYSAVGVN